MQTVISLEHLPPVIKASRFKYQEQHYYEAKNYLSQRCEGRTANGRKGAGYHGTGNINKLPQNHHKAYPEYGPGNTAHSAHDNHSQIPDRVRKAELFGVYYGDIVGPEGT